METKVKLPGQGDPYKERIDDAMGKIAHKVIVLSGKGGVGKSTVAVNLAYALQKNGKRVGLLDVDIHGPSIGKMTQIEGEYLQKSGDKIAPIEKDGVKIVSMSSLLASPDTPVIWRGPLKMKAIQQFLGDIDWGDLDYLIVDSPPGTGDEPLSVVQQIPSLDGSIIVTTPQDVALLDARKTVNFSKQVGISVLGVIENMSGFRCPHCGAEIDIFKVGGGLKAAKEMGLNFLGSLPLDPRIVEMSDVGKSFVLEESESSEKMRKIVRALMDIVETKQEK